MNNIKNEIMVDENNKRYIKLFFKKKGSFIDVSDMFNKIEKLNEYLLEELGTEKLDRKVPSKSLVNKFSGGYISPSLMNDTTKNPALALFGACLPRKTNDIMLIGSAFHEVAERFYKLNKEERTKENYYEIAKEMEEKWKPEDTDRFYMQVDGFWESGDYLNNNDDTKYIYHKGLDVLTEEFYVTEGIKKFGIEMTVPIYSVIDRIDIRDGKIYVLDYKTGGKSVSNKLITFDGYLTQMIFYKWIVEHQYGQEVESVLLSLPAAKTYKEVKIDLVSESILVENIFKYLESIKKMYKDKLFKYNPGRGYFTSPERIEFKQFMDNANDGDRFEFNFYIDPDELG